MSDHSGFVDLRLGHGAQGIGDDSVWPSFTDIMTVVVMIFLMALVVIILRNFDLTLELDRTLSAKDAVSVESAALGRQVQAQQREIGILEQSLSVTEQQRDVLREELKAGEHQIRSLTLEQTAIQEQLASLLAEVTVLSELRKNLLEQTEAIRMEFADENQDPLSINQAVSLIIENNAKLSEERQAALDEIARVNASKLALARQMAGMGQRIDELMKNKRIAEQDADVAKRQIAALSESRDLLSAELTVSEEEISRLSNVKEGLVEQVSKLNRRLAAFKLESEGQISTLSSRNQSLAEKLTLLTEQLIGLELVIERQKTEKETLAGQLREADLLQRETELGVVTAQEKVLVLMDLIKQREAENAALEKAARAAGERFHSLQDEYSALEEEFRDLVRPARSTAGKYVVEVWLLKTETGFGYQYRQPEHDQAQSVTERQLHARLSALKDQFGNRLYTQIIIPDSTEVSYSEAWSFTSDILNKYDYYSQQ